MKNFDQLLYALPFVRPMLRALKALLALLRLVVWGLLQPISLIYHRVQALFFLRVSKGLAAARSDAHSLCVFAHYDEHKFVADYVIHYVSQLHEAGCDIVFVSTCRLPEVELAKLFPYCLQIVIRPNLGYDFGSYRTGYDFVQHMLGDYDRLIFTNDSVYGPVRPLASFFAKLAALEYDMTGVTENWEHKYHVQSYFLSFSAKAAASEELRRVLSSLIYFPWSKWAVIFYGEMALTAKLIKKGFTAGAVYPYTHVRRAFLSLDTEASSMMPRGRFVNPTHYFWATLVEDFDCPFVKIELFRSNPVGIPVSPRWLELISDAGYDPNLIFAHLKRVNARGGAL